MYVCGVLIVGFVLVAWPCHPLKLMEMKWTSFVVLYVLSCKLRTCLAALAAAFPSVTRVSHLANSSAMLANPPPEIRNHLFAAMENPYQILLSHK